MLLRFPSRGLQLAVTSARKLIAVGNKLKDDTEVQELLQALYSKIT